MKVQITNKGRELGLSMFKQALPFFEDAAKKREELKDVRKNIHKEFKDMKKDIMENGFIDDEGIIQKEFDEEKVDKIIETIKFFCLHLIALKEREGYGKTQDIVDFINKKISLFENPFKY